jgi:hypothetical protein
MCDSLAQCLKSVTPLAAEKPITISCEHKQPLSFCNEGAGGEVFLNGLRPDNLDAIALGARILIVDIFLIVRYT